MKTIRSKTLAAVAATAVAFSFIAYGQVIAPLPLPAEWRASNGDYFGLNTSAEPILRVGTSNYVGLSLTTTNLYAAGVSNRVRIVRGVIVGVDPL